jgi:hypothetical protein
MVGWEEEEGGGKRLTVRNHNKVHKKDATRAGILISLLTKENKIEP